MITEEFFKAVDGVSVGFDSQIGGECLWFEDPLVCGVMGCGEAVQDDRSKGLSPKPIGATIRPKKEKPDPFKIHIINGGQWTLEQIQLSIGWLFSKKR